MPFAASVVPERAMISDIYRDNAQNILEKSSVSHMIGLLQQLNTISAYASEIFADIFNETEKNAKRISAVRERVNKIEQQAPKVEKMFADNAPSYFYDHPFTQREWQRRDPLHGLLFRRDRSSAQVNRRRDFAMNAPDFSVMDQFSPSGPCIKNYSDPNFFMNEWLEAEKRKMEEEREKRKQRKERKKKKAKREVKRKILAVQKKTFNAMGAEFADADQQAGSSEVIVKEYTLSGENGQAPRTSDIVANSPPAPAGNDQYDLNRKSKKLSLAPKHHPAQASYMNQNGAGASPIAQPAPGGAGGPPPPSHSQPSPAMESGPPPAAFGMGGGGPPVPPPAPGGGGPPPAPGVGGPPAPPVPGGGRGGPPPAVPVAAVQQQPRRPLTGAEMAARSAAMATNNPAPVIAYERKEPEPAKAILPTRSMNFLSEIKGGTKLKSVQNIKREKPVDARSMLLANLKKGATLKHVDPSKKPAKKEEEMDRTVHAILQRRAFLEDDDSEESDESWGSESY